MSLPLVLRQEAATLAVELNKLYGAAKIPQLPEVVEAADAFLLLYVVERIRLNCALFIPQCKQTADTGVWFRSRGVDFEILTSERISKYEEFDIAFIRRDYRQDMTVTTAGSANVNEVGRYKNVVVESSAGLSIRGDDVARFAATLIEVTYRWIRETLERLVKADESEMVRALYSDFRSACVNDRLRETLVFAAVTKGHTLYLVDREYAMHAMAIAARASAAFMESPARVVAEILNTDIPYDLSMSKIAIDTGRTRTADFQRAKYKDATGAFLPFAEAIVHASKAVAVYPIVREGNELLVAVAPSTLRQEVERTFPPIAERLAVQFTERRGALGHILGRILSRLPGETGGDIAYWLGRFTSGVLHAH